MRSKGGVNKATMNISIVAIACLTLVCLEGKKKSARKNVYQNPGKDVYEKYKYPRNAVQAQRKPFANPRKVPQVQQEVQVSVAEEESEVILEELVVVEDHVMEPSSEVVLSIMTIDPTPTTSYAHTVYETVTEIDSATVVTVQKTITTTYDRWE